MNFKHGLMLSSAVLAVAGCGGGSDPKPSPDPFVSFIVSVDRDGDSRLDRTYVWNKDLPTSITVPWGQATEDQAFDTCDPEEFINGDDVRAAESDYCVDDFRLVYAYVEFGVKYVNASYDSVPLDFSGLGFEVRIFDYTGGVIGDEVWNTSYAAQQIVDDFNGKVDDDDQVDPFDPTNPGDVVLDASDSYPSYNSYTRIRFNGQRNFDASSALPGTVEANEADYDPSYLFRSPAGDDLCNWNLVFNSVEGKYEKVWCLADTSLLPEVDSTEDRQFLIRTTINFNGQSEQPHDIVLTLTSPN